MSAAIANGELLGGERLPTHRALADSLGVDLTTVTRAYAEARRRGLLQATVGRGTFVRPPSQALPAGAKAGEVVVDLGMNLPPLPADPPLQDLLQQGLSGLLASSDPAELLTYRTGSGTAAERMAGALWLRPTLGEVDPERVLICPGAQPALHAVLGAVAGSGDVVLTDRLTYPGLRGAAAQLGIRLVGVPADAQGLLPKALDAACRANGPKALCCLPTIQNPTTVTMPLERRQAIADVARWHHLTMLEDDAYGLLPATPIPAIASLLPSLGFHVSTLSKVISPALRVAYLVAPDAAWASRLRAVLRANVLMASPLLTGLATSWIRDGIAPTITSAIRRESLARQKIAREILPPGSFDAEAEGLHLWLRLPSYWDRRDFVAHLRRVSGLAVVPSDAFLVGSAEQPPQAVRLSLGAAADRESLRRALGSVAQVLSEPGPASFSDIV